jgi:hypothetical protein
LETSSKIEPTSVWDAGSMRRGENRTRDEAAVLGALERKMS